MTELAREVEEVLKEGYIVLPRLLSPTEVSEARSSLQAHLRREHLGRNNFEGHLTERVYALVDKGAVFAALVEHPHILELCDAFLEPNYLLTASQAIQIHPGETAQAPHTDDLFYRIPRPRKAVSVSTIVAIDDFTEENGATQIIPGSQTWSDEEILRLLQPIDFETAPKGTRPAEAGVPTEIEELMRTVAMPAGSIIFFLGTLVHRGGANRSQRPRLALSNQYCEPWARQQENYALAISPERVRNMPERVQQLLGYSIHPPFMGHINGLHPRRLLQ